MNKTKHIALGCFFGIIYIVIMINRKYLKTHYTNDILEYILNTMPNFFAGICFTYIFYRAGIYLFNRKMVILAFFLTTIWLTIEEFYPIFSHNDYFDYNDIFMSFVGGLVVLFIFKYDSRKK